MAAACGTTSSGPRSPAASMGSEEGEGKGAPPTPPDRRPPAETVLPVGRRWRPTAREVEPQVKLAAARVIQALGVASATTSARQLLTDVDASPDLAPQAGPLIPPATPAVVHIVYPQYGGLTETAASVMAVVEQSWLADGRVRRRTVTADLRLTREADGWAVSALHPVRPTGATLALSGPATRLAGTPGVQLPDAALVDLARGTVDPRVVSALLTLSKDFEMSVSVFRSGHPTKVLGTDRTSNHARGRAVDIWAINGRPVITMTADDRTLVDFLTQAGTTGSDEIGGPITPDGSGSAYFTNAVHRDHVHLGFDS